METIKYFSEKIHLTIGKRLYKHFNNGHEVFYEKMSLKPLRIISTILLEIYYTFLKKSFVKYCKNNIHQIIQKNLVSFTNPIIISRRQTNIHPVSQVRPNLEFRLIFMERSN